MHLYFKECYFFSLSNINLFIILRNHHEKKFILVV